MLEIPVLAGREFNRDQEILIRSNLGDEERRMPFVMLNRTAAQALGFESPDAAVNKIIYRVLPIRPQA